MKLERKFSHNKFEDEVSMGGVKYLQTCARTLLTSCSVLCGISAEGVSSCNLLATCEKTDERRKGDLRMQKWSMTESQRDAEGRLTLAIIASSLRHMLPIS